MSDATVPPSRVYTNPGISGRPTLSIVIVTIAGLYGAFELWRAWSQGFQSQMDLIFGLFFVGGGIYGFNKTWSEARDTVLTLDVDEGTQHATVALWRPFRPLILETGLDGLTGWRHFIKLGPRGDKTHVILANCAGYPRQIRFELPRGQPLPVGLRRIAPEAVAEYEDATGAAA